MPRQAVTPDDPPPTCVAPRQAAPINGGMLQGLIDHIHESRARSVAAGESREPVFDGMTGIADINPKGLLLTPNQIVLFHDQMPPGGQTIHLIQRPPVKHAGTRLNIPPLAGILRSNLSEECAEVSRRKSAPRRADEPWQMQIPRSGRYRESRDHQYRHRGPAQQAQAIHKILPTAGESSCLPDPYTPPDESNRSGYPTVIQASL